MQAIAIFAFVVGVAVFVVLAIVSLSSEGKRPRQGDGGPIVPIGRQHGDDDWT
jgi:hypothetical protein